MRESLSKGAIHLLDFKGTYNITNCLVYSFHNCIGLCISCTDGATLYSVVICHHNFESKLVLFDSM